uniref:Uncharacterized protein n=1 Tax=Anguilla anguilla TaxID=7936 RepID=A0A0E9TQQ4_ANGAN
MAGKGYVQHGGLGAGEKVFGFLSVPVPCLSVLI